LHTNPYSIPLPKEGGVDYGVVRKYDPLRLSFSARREHLAMLSPGTFE